MPQNPHFMPHHNESKTSGFVILLVSSGTPFQVLLLSCFKVSLYGVGCCIVFSGFKLKPVYKTEAVPLSTNSLIFRPVHQTMTT